MLNGISPIISESQLEPKSWEKLKGLLDICMKDLAIIKFYSLYNQGLWIYVGGLFGREFRWKMEFWTIDFTAVCIDGQY